MDSAERRIRRAGYGGFSFRDIAVEVGVTSAAIHYHFPTKDGLAAAVARRYNDRITETVERECAAGTGIVEAWRRVFRSALDDGARMCLCGSLGVTTGELAPGVQDEVRRFFDLAVASLMTGGMSRARATQVLATLEGAILMASVRDDPCVFDMAVGGLG